MPIFSWDFLDNICTCEVDEQGPTSSETRTVTGAARNLIRTTKLRALKINEEHNVVDRSKNMSKNLLQNAKEFGTKVGQRVKELDDKHRVAGSFQVVVAETSDAAQKTWKQVDDRHKISSTSSSAFIKGANFLSEHLDPKDAESADMEDLHFDVKLVENSGEKH